MLGWVHSRGFSAGVMVGVLVIGVVAAVAAFLNKPIVVGVVAVITTVAGLVMTKQQKAIDAGHALRKRWTDAVDPVARSLGAPKESIAALLRPELEIVPYNNIHIEQLRTLLKWALAPDAAALRFLTGGAGSGKTRTARQLARLLQGRTGWQCGVARPGREAQAVVAAIESRIPTLLIIEQGFRQEAVVEALAALARPDGRSHVRVLVVTRNAEMWRERMSACDDDDSARLILAAGRTELGIPSAGPHGHYQQFERAVSAFAQARGVDAPHIRLELTDPNVSVLAVHATALLAVLDAEFSTMRALGNRRPCDRNVFGHLLRHEAGPQGWDWCRS